MRRNGRDQGSAVEERYTTPPPAEFDMRSFQSSAIVLGASMSGLLAARALSPHFSRVTIVERDVLPLGAELRKGVPQAAHAHGLLASGSAQMESYFPGLLDELSAIGAPIGD